MELVDTRDLKSLDSNIVPVQVRPRAPYNKLMKNWLIVSYKSNKVKIVEKNLLNQRFDYYLPKITIKKINSSKKVEVLFPGYIFVNVDIANYSALQHTRGIKNIVKFGDNIPFINEDEINAIKEVEEISELNPVRPKIKIGQNAFISNGSLKGNIVKILSLPSKERVEILLSFLGAIRRVSIPKKDLAF